MKKLTSLLLCVCLASQIALAGDVVKVCGQNVQNFFYSLDRTRTTDNGIDISNYTTEAGRTAKLNAIINALAPQKADIYAFNEVECCPEVMTLLAQRMSQVTGLSYAPVEDGLTYDKATEPGGVLKAGFIYNTSTVKPYGANTPTGSGYVYTRFMRMQAFETLNSHERFTLSMNHFKAGSVEENWEARVANAQSLLAALPGALDPDIIVMGDLNSEMGEQCLNLIVEAGYTEQLYRFGPNGFTHCWGGGEIIDHVFANSSMAEQVTNAEILEIANPCSTNNPYSDHNPYTVTLNLESSGAPQYVRATTASAGNQYVFVGTINGNLEAALPVNTRYEYGYWTTQAVNEVDGVIEDIPQNMLFDFEDAGDGTFVIKDSNNRYVSQGKRDNGSYFNSFTMTTDPGEAHTFTATPQADGTFKIINTVSNYFIQTGLYNDAGEFGMWSSLASSRGLPYLYELKNTTGITQPTTYNLRPTTIYNLAGQRVQTPTHGIYIINGKKVVIK